MPRTDADQKPSNSTPNRELSNRNLRHNTGEPTRVDAREAVLAIVRLIPVGRVVSYGDVAELVGIGPRQVGRIMATHGDTEETAEFEEVGLGEDGPMDERARNDEGPVPWWRVTNSSGDLPPHLRDEAFARYRQEGTPIKRNGRGAAIRTHRADLPALADAAEAILGPLPGAAG